METTKTKNYIPEHLKAAHERRIALKMAIPERVAIQGLEKHEPAPPILGLK